MEQTTQLESEKAEPFVFSEARRRWIEQMENTEPRRYWFTRAGLVLDTGLEYLRDALEDRRFEVRRRGNSSDASFIKALALDILVTDRYKTYYYEAPVIQFSIIDIAEATSEPEETAKRISDAFLDYRLKEKQPFFLRLKADGQVELRLIC